MAESQIVPHRITKPIQLLAAWLAGLAIVNGSFLTAAATVHTPSWASGLLVVAAVANVPLFLASLFLLQTKFRPQMQEDSYYSQYLEKTYSVKAQLASPRGATKPLHELAEKIVAEVEHAPNGGQQDRQDKVVALLRDSELEYLAQRFGQTRTLSELYMYPNLWKELLRSWGENPSFRSDLESLVEAGLIDLPDQNVAKARLTASGQAVAARMEAEKKLWNQTNERFMQETRQSKPE